MQILIIRHAPAADREEFILSGQADELRPLTDKGKEKMRKAVPGIYCLVPKLQAIASSPFLRAQQTADLLATAYPHIQRDILPALVPLGAMTQVLSYLQDHAHTTHTIALVGHEPDLGQLATWLLTNQADDWFPLKKGAACFLEFEENVQPGEAVLRWALTSNQLQQLKS